MLYQPLAARHRSNRGHALSIEKRLFRIADCVQWGMPIAIGGQTQNKLSVNSYLPILPTSEETDSFIVAEYILL
jgi:hypothetical protein